VGMEGNDAAMVARARAGDAEAFQTLVEGHARAVFRLAYRMTGNEHDAEDVVQEAFLKAYRSLGQFEDRAHFGSWLHRITANCAFDLLRGRKRRPHMVSTSEDEDLPMEIPSGSPGPERLALSSEVRRRVEGGLGRLTEMERSAFVLRHFEGLSIEEIGSVLGTDTNATKSSVFRAVRKMRRALEPIGGA